jgi:hypothetical protein
LVGFGRGLGLPDEFLVDEVDYVLGRYPHGDLGGYLDATNRELYTRHTRGLTPAMGLGRRRRLIEEVIDPYRAWKAHEAIADWNDIAIAALEADVSPFDVVVVDEAQDFSANMMRTVLGHLADDHSVTFVLDATQRVYPHGFSWREVGLEIRPARDVQTLRVNHRNTKRIAALARPLVEGLPPDADGQLPDLDACESVGEMPVLVRVRFTAQMDYVVEFVSGLPADESVALLHPMGGGWFDEVRLRLDAVGLRYVDLQRRKTWPRGDEEVGLTTLLSAKGLEFDHVVLLGLEQQHLDHGADAEDTQLARHRRLLAMAIARARRSVTIAYKPETKPDVLDLLDRRTYKEIEL